MGIFAEEFEDAIFFSRLDDDEMLGSRIHQPFLLDDYNWPSAEHYTQALLFKDASIQQQIRESDDPLEAAKQYKWRFWLKHKDWKKRGPILMTRAIYTQCKTYPVKAQALLDSEDRLLMENSLYDYFWGCGRDRRGDNRYGKVLMSVRGRLRKEAAQEQ